MRRANEARRGEFSTTRVAPILPLGSSRNIKREVPKKSIEDETKRVGGSPVKEGGRSRAVPSRQERFVSGQWYGCQDTTHQQF